MVYQHSAWAGIWWWICFDAGGHVFPAGRSESFVPIDTENIQAEQLDRIQELANEVWRAEGAFDAVVSTDGDSDRPLVLGVEPQRDPGAPCEFASTAGICWAWSWRIIWARTRWWCP